MEMERKVMARGDRLSDLPDAILLHILSMLLWDSKAVVRTSVLSQRWRFLWKSVPVSLDFESPNSYSEKDFIASTNRELYYWRSCQKIRRFRGSLFRYDNSYVKDVDLWVHFATKVANVEELTLLFDSDNHPKYELPNFAYKNTLLRSLILINCELKPSGSVNWNSLVFLSIASLNLTDNMLEKILSGCPNLEHLELDCVLGISRLEISSVKLTFLSLKDYQNKNPDLSPLEILAPHIKYFELLGFCNEIRLRNVASLVSAILSSNFDYIVDEERNSEAEDGYLKEFLHIVAYVEDLELGPWGIECLSILELKGWQSPPSSRKYLKLDTALEQLDFLGICSFLQSSPDLETLVIDWYNKKRRDLLSRYTNEDEHIKRFKTHNYNCSLLHLKTIKIIDYDGTLSGNKSVLPLVKYLLKNATMLEKFVITAKFEGSDMSQDYVKMAQEFQSFPRASLHAELSFLMDNS
ncbi:F-box protein At5g03100 [Nicotiana tabacum]|uniref:F-box protein At5g03100 n=1 Tax=Nicotiana tabacum TaxID=4097 RepID=A0A1S4CIE8_TOBAC|nr:F-box protein At5g03100-like [Nicotiana tomentosiformis]XP_016500982.1 PREDICTED: F-box protein At5g03100-like [Nicotiana tabacum]